MRLLIENRTFVSFVLSAAIGLTLFYRLPFPAGNNLLLLIALQKPYIYHAIRAAYTMMLFTTPFLVSSVLFSLVYIFVMKHQKQLGVYKLPPYPVPPLREKLFLVMGELHHPRRREPAENPAWLKIPPRGLYTGTMIFGAIGSGKTSSCMYPFAEQVFAYRAKDRAVRPGGLFLEVKGDFCYKIQEILEKNGRSEDYFEIGIESNYRYNPLHNDLEAFAMAYGIASLLNNLYGRGKEPFWQQAYTNMIKFIILLHKVAYDYVTLFNVYECAINMDIIGKRIAEAEALFQTASVLVDPDTYMKHSELDQFAWVNDQETGGMRASRSEEIEAYLNANGILYELMSGPDQSQPDRDRKKQQLAAVKRWFEHDWKKIDNKLRTSVVEGISVFLSLFDDNPDVKRVFCPPKECYDPVKNKDGRYGVPMPAFSEMIESGKVVALNFPSASNPGLAKAIGTFLKLDFQRAMLMRIPEMAKKPDQAFRPVLFLCDEYQMFATVGESDPSGDEKFFAQSRQAKCIPIVATQSVSSLRSTLSGEGWRTLMQTFRTKIFLATADDYSAQLAADLCGKAEQIKVNYSISENGQDAKVSVLSGRTVAHKSTVTASKSYNLQRDYVFEPKLFTELRNAESVILAYDGVNPLPAQLCYLKPYYLDPNLNYFEQLERGLLSSDEL